ncbi:kinase-like protein [Polyplosphaeria fusca]|uniref:Kinase-like protein n=1 Tax=Polyplosphaeria fusca TaxID=682080 RepID=A0A9P4QZ46_9PLEO|nr:kinase-like protein [Polyplosphaeria fusca]
MAPISGSSHTFQKLKIDTSAPHKTVASTFASIPRRDSRNDTVSSHVELDNSAVADSQAHANGRNGKQEQDLAEAEYAIADGLAVGSVDIESQFRNRATSISFDKEVTLDSGNRLSIEQPLPKPLKADPSPDFSDSEEYSDREYVETPLDRRKRLQHHVGEPRYPLLQATVDELAIEPEYKDHDQEHVASLTSAATASPLVDEVRTPLEIPGEYLLSPVAVSSPIEFPTFLARRNGSQRSRSYRSELANGEGSYRRTSRRSSTRSGRSLSSMSPAASFLAMYNATDAPLKPSEPDDEGQGIGYHGEYIIGKQLGFGGFSVVKEVTTMEGGEKIVHAVKIVRKQLRGREELENEQIQTQFDHEVEIWRFLRHSYILPLLRVYSTDFATYCITRLNKGGTLLDLIRDTHRKKKRGLLAHVAKRYAYQLASAIRYLHNDVLIVHRDIKPENCLVDMTIPDAERDGGDVLLCDFGMADFIVSDQRDGPEPHSAGLNQNIGPADTSTSVAGSLKYAAPELFDAAGPVFSPPADIWAYGVVVYALLTAQLPFNEGLDAKTAAKIRRGDWDIEALRSAHAASEGNIDDAIELVKGCLDMKPERRWTINDVLSCAWLHGCMEKFENLSRSWLVVS